MVYFFARHMLCRRSVRNFAALQAALVIMVACGKKEEAPATHSDKSPPQAASTPAADVSKTEFVCSYAPSQSTVMSEIASAGGGAAAVTAALAQALGFSVVAHSSGAAILTGSGGYIAGTLGSAALAGPVLVAVGATVAGLSVGVELLCAPKNHPDLVAKVNASAAEFVTRTKSSAAASTKKIGAFVVGNVVTVLKSGDDAINYANRKAAAIGGRL